MHLFGRHAVERLVVAAQRVFGMRDETAARAEGHDHRAGRRELAAQRMQVGLVERGDGVAVDAFADVARDAGRRTRFRWA